MSDTETLSPEEQKYFDTAGAEGPEPSQEPAQPTEPAPLETEGGAEPQKPVAAADKPKFVPHGAFHQERELRKAAEARAERIERLLHGLVSQAGQPPQQQPAEPAAPAIPEFNADPKGWLEGQLAAIRRDLQPVQQLTQEQQRQAHQQAQLQDLQHWGMQQEQDYAKATPDYSDAANFLRQSRDAELQALGIVTEAQRQQIIAQDVVALATAARQGGANMAERIYALAKGRGYQAKAAAPPANDEAKRADDEAKLDTIARGQQLGRGGGAGGQAPALEITDKQAANMSDEEFGALPEKTRRRILGG